MFGICWIDKRIEGISRLKESRTARAVETLQSRGPAGHRHEAIATSSESPRPLARFSSVPRKLFDGIKAVQIPSANPLRSKSVYRGQKSTICESKNFTLCSCARRRRTRPGVLLILMTKADSGTFRILAIRAFLSPENTSLDSSAHDARYS